MEEGEIEQDEVKDWRRMTRRGRNCDFNVCFELDEVKDWRRMNGRGRNCGFELDEVKD